MAHWTNLFAIAVAVVLGAPLTHAQLTGPQPVFEVVSVKPVPGDVLETRPTRSGGRITWTTDLWYLIGYAYNLQASRISGPIPDSAHIYKVDALTGPASTDDQIRLMFRSMLADRFKMTAHLMTKDSDGYALSIARGVPKIEEAKAGDKPAPLPEWSRDARIPDIEGTIAATLPKAGVVAITGRRVSILQLAETLQRSLGQMVWDQTGLPGNYYFAFSYARDDSIDTDAPTLGTALQENLGLKLEKRKGPVETLVVDRIEKDPTEN